MLVNPTEIAQILSEIGIQQSFSFPPGEFPKYKEIAKSNSSKGIITALITSTGTRYPRVDPIDFSQLPYVVDVYIVECGEQNIMVSIYHPKLVNTQREVIR